MFAVALSASFPAERIYPWLTVVTGAVALVLGGALLALRVRALRRGTDMHGHTHPWDERADHGHEHHEHADPRGPADHEHADERELVLVGAAASGSIGALANGPAGPAASTAHHHEGVEHHHDDLLPALDAPQQHPGHGEQGVPAVAAPSKGSVSRPRLPALAVSGGILPSPTALVVLLAAISAHRVAYGLALIVAFSAGLAAALIAIAMVALRARGLGRSQARDPDAAASCRSCPPWSSSGFGMFFLTKGVLQVGV